MGAKISDKEQTFSNKTIVVLKIISACMLLFGCSWFFLRNMGMFWRDITSYMFFFPILFFLGIILVLIYVAILVSAVENKNLVHSDRFDIAYRLVFTAVFLMLLIRSFFGDFNVTDGVVLCVPVEIIGLVISSGIITWTLPRIQDNDSSDF